jgi:hypothetical protein
VIGGRGRGSRPANDDEDPPTTWRGSELLPLGLAFIAEAAWLSVLGGVVQGFVKADPVVGLLPMTAFVAAGAVCARLAGPRLGAWWPLAVVGLTIAGSLAGVMLSAGAQAIVSARGLGAIGDALLVNLGGVLAGAAVLRGTAYGVAGISAERLERLLVAGMALIVGAAVVGGLAVEPWRGRFIADAALAALVFVTAGTVALALRRQVAEDRDRGADWQRNPKWVALLVAVVVTLAALAAMSAGLVRPALEVLIGVSIMPLIVLGLIFGWTRRGVYAALAFAGIAGVVVLAFHLLGGADLPSILRPGAPELAETPPAGELEPAVATLGVGLTLLLAAIAIYVLARLWSRRRAGAEDDPTEERYIDRPAAAAAGRAGRSRFRLPWQRAPRDAVGAYRLLLREIEERDVVRRQAWETPREHAARLRREEVGGLPLELLAADYGLVVFGDTSLTEREQRRAVARWRVLRRTLHAPPPPDLADG